MTLIRTPNALRWWVGAIACAISMISLAAVSGYNLPNLGEPADTAMSPAQQKKVGAQVLYRLRVHNAIIEDPELEAYINRVGRRLVRQTDSSPGNIHYYVIDNHQINSFALPGGNVGIFIGMITATDNESELASVMAHETAHEVQNHIPRQMADSKGKTIATLATALVAAIAGVAAGAGEAAPAALMGGMASLGQQQISYTRADENEADRVGIRILAAAHYNPEAMAALFEKLQRNADLYGHQLPQILLTHPVGTTRMAEAQARAANYPPLKVHTSPDYPFMKERARVLGANSLSDLDQYYERRLVAPDATPADSYGYALALIRLGNTRKAIAILKPRVAAHPNTLPLVLALAEAQAHAGHLGRAKTLLAKARPRFPNSEALKFDYARILEQSGQPKAMRDFMLSQSHMLATMPAAQKLLAKGAGQQGNLGEAYYRQARYYAMFDDYPDAVDQLRTALQTAKLSAYNKSRLSALRDQMVAA